MVRNRKNKNNLDTTIDSKSHDFSKFDKIHWNNENLPAFFRISQHLLEIRYPLRHTAIAGINNKMKSNNKCLVCERKVQINKVKPNLSIIRKSQSKMFGTNLRRVFKPKPHSNLIYSLFSLSLSLSLSRNNIKWFSIFTYTTHWMCI